MPDCGLWCYIEGLAGLREERPAASTDFKFLINLVVLSTSFESKSQLTYRRPRQFYLFSFDRYAKKLFESMFRHFLQGFCFVCVCLCSSLCERE